MSKTPQRFHLTWKLTPHPHGIPIDDIPPEHGGCDAAIVISMIRPPSDTMYSQALASMDGYGPERLTPKDFFRAWLMMGWQLVEMTGLPAPHRAFIRFVCESFRTMCHETEGAACSACPPPEGVPASCPITLGLPGLDHQSTSSSPLR